ncbi:MAG TPA: hypothetical protein DCS97_05055 [Planctomycetes bacterium]|nr:hypothetical protein [Planctomycetota bacterium]
MTMIVPSGEAGSMSCSGAFAGLPGCCATTSPRTLRRNPGGGRRQPLLALLLAVGAALSAADPAQTTLSVQASDPDGDGLTYTWAKTTGPGTVTFGVSNGTATGNSCTAVAAAVGSYTFTVTVSDGRGGSASSTTGSVVWTNKPVAQAQSATTAEDTSRAITLAGSDADGSISSYEILTGPAHGTLSGSAAARSYQPAANFSGSDSFTFRVIDNLGVASDAATVSLTVTAVNDPPTVSVLADQTSAMGGSTGALAFTVGDVEMAATSLTVAGGSSNQTLVPTGNIVFGGSGASRTVTVTPAAGQSGTSTITVTVGDGAASVVETFLLTVTAPNQTTVPVIGTTSGLTSAFPSLAGTAVNSATIRVYDGGTLIGSLTADPATGQWLWTPATGLAVGSHSLTVTAQAPGQQESIASTPIVVTVSASGGGSTVSGVSGGGGGGCGVGALAALLLAGLTLRHRRRC